MKVLSDILKSVKLTQVIGNTEMPVTDIVFDSRKTELGCLFVATKGTKVDGHNYIEVAIEKGAKAVVCEEFPKNKYDDIVFIKVIAHLNAYPFIIVII